MYVLITLRKSNKDNRDYVLSWGLSQVTIEEESTGTMAIPIKQVPHDLFNDPHRWYYTPEDGFRKNPHRKTHEI